MTCLGFALGCTMIVTGQRNNEHLIGWAGLAFFGGGGIVYLVLGLTGNAGLRLDEDGFFFAASRRTYRYEWRNVTAFSVIRVGRVRTKLVGFSVTNQTDMLQSFNQSMIGAGGALPNFYALKPETLAGLMNTYREQALRRAPRDKTADWRDDAVRAVFGQKV